MATISEAALTPPSVYLARVALPKTTQLIYEEVFRNTDEATQIQLKKISDFRNEVVVASERAFAEAAIKGVNKYLPSLYGLMDATEKLPPDFLKRLDISWTSYLCSKDGRKQSHGSWMFEAVFVMASFGLLHRKMAVEKLSTMSPDEFNTKYVDVVKLLSQAAGVFDHIAESYMSRFFVNPKDLPLPETLAETFKFLSSLCLAEQQELIVKRSIASKNKVTLIAKLCAGTALCYDNCMKMAKAIREQTTHPKLPLLEHWWDDYLLWKRQLYDSNAQRFMAIHHQEAGQPGIAIAYAQIAVKTISQAINPGNHHSENTTHLWQIISEQRNLIIKIWQDFSHDNDTIYHETIKFDEVVAIEAKVLAKTQKFEPPAKADINVVRKESSFLCVIQ